MLQYLRRCAAPLLTVGRSLGHSGPTPSLPQAPSPRWAALHHYSTALDMQQWMRENDVTCSGADPPPPLLTFQEGQWPKWVADAIQSQGFDKPTLIQSISWGVALQGRDMIGIAATGSGKTLGFSLPCLMTSMKNPRKLRHDGPSSLVVCPTRELAQQTFSAIRSLSRHTKLRSACLFGGSAKSLQLDVLAKGVDVVVCTPGRLIDLVEGGAVSLNRVTYLVLDEADRMLDMGFEPQVRQIFQGCPQAKQTLMWSATWPKEIRALAAEFLRDPVQITVGSTDLAANKDITQHVIVCTPLEKAERLTELLQGPLRGQKLLIFAATKSAVDSLQMRLEGLGFNAHSIHGDKSQVNREYTVRSFRLNKDFILVATDVAARGLDVRDIDAVINYDFPHQIQDFIHRVGRTARGGAKGEAYTLFTEKDSRLAGDLVKVMRKAGQAVPAALEELVVEKAPPPVRRPHNAGGHVYRSTQAPNRRHFPNTRHTSDFQPRKSWGHRPPAHPPRFPHSHPHGHRGGRGRPLSPQADHDDSQ